MEIIFKMDLPDNVLNNKQVQSSVKSALGSTGFFLRQETLKHIDSQGSYLGQKWKGLHSITKLRTRKQFGKQVKRTLNKNKKPLAKLKGFVRYRADSNAVQLLFTSKKKGKPGNLDRSILPVVRRQEQGEIIPLTKRSRKFRAALGFPVSKDLSQIRIPKRPILTPVWSSLRGKSEEVFRKKFSESIARKQKQKQKQRRK